MAMKPPSANPDADSGTSLSSGIGTPRSGVKYQYTVCVGKASAIVAAAVPAMAITMSSTIRGNDSSRALTICQGRVAARIHVSELLRSPPRLPSRSSWGSVL